MVQSVHTLTGLPSFVSNRFLILFLAGLLFRLFGGDGLRGVTSAFSGTKLEIRGGIIL